jgi:CHAT domain-containing protein
MALDAKDREEVRLYLLGRLKPEQRLELLEERIMTEQDYYEELLAIEDEVIDQYLANELSRDDREAFEQYFLRTPQRASKLRFARAFSKYVAAAPKVSAETAPVRQNLGDIFRSLFAAPVRVAVVALVLVFCIAAAWWVFFRSNSEVDKGLVALREAYGSRRPLEARITGFEYAPWSVTRGGSSAQEVNANSLNRAERILLDAVHERPNAASWHALGQLYLAERKYDQAIAQFEEALKTDKDNAQLHNDFGVALFEKGRMERDRDGSEKNIESLARSIEQFKRAVELNDSLTEAHFNRALAYQEMMLRQQAEEAWKEYLRKDSTSPWADEARRHLKLLEESKSTRSQKTDTLLREFLDARRAGDDNAAWKAVSQSYTSAGNEVTNRLLDSQLGLASDESLAEHDVSLQALSYLAQLELNHTGNRFTSHLVRNYQRMSPERRSLLKGARQHMKNGHTLLTASKYAEAVDEYTKAQFDYERAGDSAERVFAEYRLALCYIFLLDYEKARAAFEHLSTVARTNDYHWLSANCLYRLAHISADNSEYSKAVDYSSRALTTFERLGDIDGELRCLVQLAIVHGDINRIGRSFGYLQSRLVMTDEISAEPMQRWGILVAIASSLSSKRLDTAALFYQKEALSIALEMKYPLYESRSYGYLGSAYASMKLYAEAMRQATEALKIGEEIKDFEMMANAWLQSGDIHRLAGECGEAVQAYDKSIQLYDKLNFEYYRYAAHKGKLLCYLANSDDRAAGGELQTVLALFEQYRAKITTESHRNSFFDMEQSVYDLAMNYEFTRMNNPDKAFEYSEVSRARSLLDELRRGAEVLEKNDGPEINLSGVTSSMSLAEIQKELPGNTQILQFAVLEDRLLLWVLTNSSIRQREVPIGAQQLTEKVRSLLDAVGKPPSANNTDYLSRVKDLYQVLIAPAEPFLDKTKFLCIVPDKILHYLPYSALMSPVTDRYLMEDYNFGLAPSSSIFVSVSASASKKAGAIDERLLSVGDANFKRASFPSLTNLPSAAREANKVSDFYKPSRVLVRDEAREQVVKSEIEKANVAHLALHYVVDESSEMLSGFPLAPELSHEGERDNFDGFLQSYEIYRMKLPRTRLVVLSACQTGIEQQYAGEGVIGVARPFLVAGVPVVVASLWPVDTDASSELMINFHRHRTRDALTVTRSLRQAQLEMARGEDMHYRHPYYWATFIAVGGHSPF